MKMRITLFFVVACHTNQGGDYTIDKANSNLRVCLVTFLFFVFILCFVFVNHK